MHTVTTARRLWQLSPRLPGIGSLSPAPRNVLRDEGALSVVLFVLAVALRLWQYLGNASLWLDEAELAQNILHRRLVELVTEPLVRDQVAPAGFLAIERLVVVALGGSESALRLIPFLASLASIPLFWRLSVRALEEPARSVARTVFAFGFALIWYGSEVKQYSTDIMLALAITVVAIELPGRLERNAWPLPLLLLGLAAGWFSTPAMLVLAGVSLALLLEALRTKTPAPRRLLPTLAVWTIGCAVAGVYSLHLVSPETQAAMHRHWREAFLPLPPWHLVDLAWPLVRLGSVFGEAGLRYAWPALELLVAIVGATSLIRARRFVALTLIGPVAVTLLAATVHVYPFSSRLVAFTMPAFLIALAQGVVTLGGFLEHRFRIPRLVGQTLLLAPVLGPVLLAPPVYRPEELRPVIEYVWHRRQPADSVFVYYRTGTALGYYLARLGLSSAGVVIGEVSGTGPRTYLREMDRFRGSPRFWVVFSHDRDEERRLMLRYLSTIGQVRDSTVAPSRIPLLSSHGASAYLFDLSDRSRLSRATAEGFPLEGDPSPSP